jgi:hypothetical protein
LHSLKEGMHIYYLGHMRDDPPESEPEDDEFGNMLDDAPTTPAEPYGDK